MRGRSVVIVDAEVYPQLAGVWRDAPYPPTVIVVDRGGAAAPEGTVDWNAEMARQSPEARTEPTYRDDFSTWLSSSGSTGKPKCVVHMHHDFVWNTIAYAQRTLGLTRDDITMSAPKLFFGYALGSNLLFPLSVGGSCVLLPERTPAEQYYALIERYKVTQMITVPTTIAKMVEHGHLAAKHDLRSLHSLVSAGEALPARIYRAWKEATGVEIFDGIGSAEMFHVYITGRPGDVKEGSLGKLVEGYTYRLVDDAGNEVPPGEIGTLEICGPSAGLGYWRMRDQSRADLPRRRGPRQRQVPRRRRRLLLVLRPRRRHAQVLGRVRLAGRGRELPARPPGGPRGRRGRLARRGRAWRRRWRSWSSRAGTRPARRWRRRSSRTRGPTSLHSRPRAGSNSSPMLPRTETGKIKRNELRKLAERLS
jgi:acyl-coenzyme A synthetase/AMP-(fatty) acid ligase